MINPSQLLMRAPVSARLALACLGLALSPPTWASTIRGNVLDPDGQRVAGATVRAQRPPAPARSVVTDAEGSFVLDALPPGTYEVRILAQGFRANPVTVVLGDDDDVRVTIALALAAVTESIVVSAAQVETVRSAVPGSVAVIDASELRAGQFENPAEALRSVPGANVTRQGGRGALTSLLPRGGESDSTLVLVDGVRQNSFGGGIDLSGLVTPDVARIEVVRGPQSALFGPDAIGGVVQVVSRQSSTPLAEALAEGGSSATFRAVASAAGGHNGWVWGGGAEHQQSDGFTGEAPASGEMVSNDDNHAAVAAMRGGYAGPAVQATGSVRHVTTERGYPGPFGTDPNGTFPGVDRISRGTTRSTDGAVRLAIAPSERLRVRADAALAEFDSEFLSPYGQSNAGTRRATGRLMGDVPVTSTFSVSAGAEVLGEEATSTYITGASSREVPVARRILGVFAEGRLSTARWQLTTGLRLDHVQRDQLEASADPYASRPALATDSTVALSPRVGVAWLASSPDASGHSWTRVRVSAGTGIRPPDAFEIAFTDNPALRPERSRSIEAGVEQGLLEGRLILEAAAFHNTYDDLIVAVGRSFEDASRFRTDNIANARSRGVELAFWSRWRGGFDLRASYTWLDTAVLAVDGTSGQAPPPFEPGDPLIRRPRHAATLVGLLTRSRWNAFARLGIRGRVLDVDPTLGAFGGTVEGPAYAVVDAGAAVRVVGRVELIGRVGNVFDARYEEAIGYPALGRYLMTGVRVAAGR